MRKLKTALELLGDDAFMACIPVAWAHPFSSEARPSAEGWVRLLELVVRRAREEAYEMAAYAIFDAVNDDGEMFLDTARAIIRALPTEPTS